MQLAHGTSSIMILPSYHYMLEGSQLLLLCPWVGNTGQRARSSCLLKRWLGQTLGVCNAYFSSQQDNYLARRFLVPATRGDELCSFQ
jgi:hypothetical protein